MSIVNSWYNFHVTFILVFDAFNELDTARSVVEVNARFSIKGVVVAGFVDVCSIATVIQRIRNYTLLTRWLFTLTYW